ncbi:glycosyltransferase family 2 protein [Flavobacterium sp.]|uniref:glycosyltransferase family 2 protein n=1 Tax=Flavobacterium sp. TaxID=239 RepID=UPI0040474692
MTLISVIIPLYNKDFSISNTLSSVLSQTYINFEIIIVNDGSTDRSLERVKQFSDSRIQLFNQENKGAATARNFGIEKAKGELIAFLDADDYWFPNHLEEIVRLYNDYPNCGIYCSRYSMKISKNKILKIDYGSHLNSNYRGIVKDIFSSSMYYRVALTSALAIPKKIFGNYFMFNPKVSSGQDLELFTKIALEHKVAITNLNTIEYNFSLENQLSKTPITKKSLLDLSQFKKAEESNLSLKKYLDLYRTEYALQFRIAGDIKKSKMYLSEITTPISTKTKILLITPVFILKALLKIKHVLKKQGIDFSVYH